MTDADDGPRLGWFPVVLAFALVAMSAWVVYEWVTMPDPTTVEDRSR